MSLRAGLKLGDLGAVPNLVTLARLALVPFALTAVARGLRGAALSVLAAMVATDWLDGYLARRMGRVTELGKVLDPVADKVAIDAVLAYLVVRGEFPLWALALIVVRDGCILAGAAYIARNSGSMPQANRLGKVTLAALGALTLVYVADAAALEPWALAAALALLVASGIVYAAALTRALSSRGGGGAAARCP